MRNRPLYLKGAVAVGALLVAAGLAASAGETKPGKAQAPAATVTLAGWTSGGGTEGNLLRRVITAFERKYRNIDVQYTQLEPYQTSMLARFAARRAPDVFYVDSNDFPTWQRQGLLEPLDSHVKRTRFNTKVFYPRLLNAFKVNGRIYGFPKDWSPLAMQVNTRMLARANVKPPTTWAQLRTAATRLRSANAVPGGRPVCFQAEWQRLLAFVYQNKGSFLNARKTRATVNSPAVRQAVNFYVGLIRSGLAGTPSQLAADWCGEAIGKEKAAIVFEGNWVYNYLKQQFPSLRFGTFAMIKNKAEGNLGFTVSYSMSRTAGNKNAAWTLLSYLTGRAGMKLWTSQGHGLPSRSDIKPITGRAPFLKAAPASRAWQFAPGFDKVITVANNELTAVIEGKQTVDGMLRKIQSEANDALR